VHIDNGPRSHRHAALRLPTLSPLPALRPPEPGATSPHTFPPFLWRLPRRPRPPPPGGGSRRPRCVHRDNRTGFEGYGGEGAHGKRLGGKRLHRFLARHHLQQQRRTMSSVHPFLGSWATKMLAMERTLKQLYIAVLARQGLHTELMLVRLRLARKDHLALPRAGCDLQLGLTGPPPQYVLVGGQPQDVDLNVKEQQVCEPQPDHKGHRARHKLHHPVPCQFNGYLSRLSHSHTPWHLLISAKAW